MAVGRVPGSPASGVSNPLQAAFVSGGTWALQSNPSQDGTINFGTMGTPSKWFDTTTAIGIDYFSLKSGKNGGGVREVLALQNRGASFGDDIALGFAPASGGTYSGGTTASPCRIEAVLVNPNIYQFRFKPANTSAVATEVLRLDGSNLVSTFFGNVSKPHAAAAKTGNYTLLDSDFTVRGDSTGGAFDITLPTAVGRSGQVFCIKRVNAGANNITIKSNGGTVETAAAGTGVPLTAQFMTRQCQSDGTDWHFIAGIG